MFACLFDGHPDIFHLIGETRFFVNFINVKNKNRLEDIDQLFLNLIGRKFTDNKFQSENKTKKPKDDIIKRDENWRPHELWTSIQNASSNIKADEDFLKSAIKTNDDKKIFLQLFSLLRKYFWKYNYSPRYILEETPDNELHLKKIFAMFPQAKVLHLVRDPFDVIESILKNQNRQGLMSYIYSWKKSLAIGIKYQKKYPKQYYFVKYENLVENTEQVMRQVADFLNIEFSDCLLRPTVHCGQEPWDCSDQSHQDIPAAIGQVDKRMLRKDARLRLGEEYMHIIGRFVGPEYNLFRWNKYKEYINKNIIKNILFKDYPGKNLKNMVKNTIKYFLYYDYGSYKNIEYF